MVAKTGVDKRIEIELHSLRLMIGDLPEIAQEWVELADGERVSWSLDWDQVMGGLQVILAPRYRAREMTAEQEARYRELLRRLEETLPVIESLRLTLPPVLLDERDR